MVLNLYDFVLGPEMNPLVTITYANFTNDVSQIPWMQMKKYALENCWMTQQTNFNDADTVYFNFG